MITINLYLTVDKHNDQLQANKEQIQCKIQGRQSSVQEDWTFWDIMVCWMINSRVLKAVLSFKMSLTSQNTWFCNEHNI